MADTVRTAILRKKIDSVLTDLMVKTSAAMVEVDSGTTLVQKLASIDSAVSDAAGKITTLNGDNTTVGSVAKSIKDAIEKITNSSETGSLDTQIKALEAAIAEINGEGEGDSIIDQANDYTDEKIGDLGQSATVRAYVDAVDTALRGLIAGAFHFRGVVDYKEEIESQYPVSNGPQTKQAGDVWQVRYAGSKPTTTGTEDPAPTPVTLNAEYAYDGTNWVELGSIVDLSGYYTKSQVDDKVSYLSTGTETAVAKTLTDAKKYTDDRIGAIGAGADGWDATTTVKTYVDNAKTEAINTAQNYTNTELGKKGRVMVTDSNTAPADMADNDLLIYLLPNA